MRHHSGIIGEIEDEIVQIERLALSGGGMQQQQQPGMYIQPQQPGMMYMQQPAGYAQGMYGAYGPPATVVQYPQPGYAMRPAYAAGPAPSPYGPGYVDSGDGRPAMIFGGAYEGVPAAGYRPAYQQPAYPVQLPPQGYAAPPPPGYAQGYPVAAQPAYVQAAPVAPQYATAPQPLQPTAGYAAAPQGPQLVAGYAAALQQAPQYAPTTQPAQVQYAVAPQPTAQPAYQQPPQYSQGTQPAVQSTPPASSYYAPVPQSSPQPQYTPQSLPRTQPAAQTASQQSPQYLQGAQPATQPASQYSAISQPSPQPQYLPAAPPSELPSYAGPSVIGANPSQFYASAGTTDQRSVLQSVGIGAAVGGAAGLGYSAYQRHQQAALQQSQFPSYLSAQDTTVRFEQVSKNIDTHHHAMKALSHSAHSIPELSNIIGTYLAAKHTSEGHVFGVASSRLEIKTYYHLMDKLEKLSADYMAKHKSSVQSWKVALGPHRRQVFSELYNNNELVRAFCLEMQGGPLALPELDSYSLGTKITSFSFARSAVRQANLRASLSVLAQVRTVILVDDSYSMTEPGHQSWGYRNETRWTQTRNLLAGITPLVAAENAHGLDLHFLNRVPFYAGLRTSQAVLSAFDSDSPNNGTPTGARVNDILDAYVSTLRYYRALMPLNLIIITDGEAQDEELLHRAIEHHVTELVHRGFPAHQFGVEFVQVGDCEHATRHLERLEKEVSRHHHRFQRDVVGVTPASRISNMNPEAMLAIAVSGVDARLNGYMRSRGVNV